MNKVTTVPELLASFRLAVQARVATLQQIRLQKRVKRLVDSLEIVLINVETAWKLHAPCRWQDKKQKKIHYVHSSFRSPNLSAYRGLSIRSQTDLCSPTERYRLLPLRPGNRVHHFSTVRQSNLRSWESCTICISRLRYLLFLVTADWHIM